jgi:hypothetical protein
LVKVRLAVESRIAGVEVVVGGGIRWGKKSAMVRIGSETSCREKCRARDN